MADLEYTVKVSGVEDVERLEKNLDNLHRTLNAGSGAGKSLEEMRKILVGMRGQASVIADLRDSVKSLNSAAESLGKGFESGFNRLDKTLKQGFQLTLDRFNMLGAEMGKSLSSGVKSAFDGGTQAAAAGGKKLVAQVNADAKAVAAAAGKFTELENKVRASVRTAMNMPSGNYQTYSPSSGLGGQIKELDRLKEAQKNATAAADPLRNALKGLTIDGNDTHSAMRGLASGFNLLWLTWGNLAPLFAGAAISNGFMQTAKQGMEVAHTLAIIEHIGGNTKEEMVALNQELLRLGTTGTFGPKDVAEAMKTLSLAGLKANEILSATQSTLNFSIAGTTSIQTAADTLVSVATAFGMGAQGFERVGDVISKAAAESKTSVESFANAMKTASVINAQYGVSLEDTATAIAAMSQLGIEGTAAGTSLRNMYADLSGRSIQVSKILRSQGIEMRNLATGGFKPMTQVVAELSDHFDTLTAVGQKNLIQALMSERGAKGLVEMLRLIKVEAKDTSKGFANALEEVRKNIEDSYGFTAVNAAKLSQTTKSLFEQVAATFKTSMYEAYVEVEPALSMIAKELKQAFASEEFKQALTDLVQGVAEVGRSLIQVGVFITDNLVAIGLLAAGYKAFTAAVKITTAAQLAQTAATRADTVANAANAASQAGKLSGLAALARFLPGVGTAITVAAGAWALYDAYQRDSSASSLDFARSYTTDVVKALNDETSKLQELNRLRREGLSLTEAQARLDDIDKRTQYVDPYANAVNKAIRAEMDARAELARREEEYAKHSAKDNKHRVEEQLTRVKRLAAATRAAKAEELEAISKVDEATRAAVDARREAAKLDEKDFEARRKALEKFGEGTFQLGQKDSFAKAGIMRDNELESLKSHFDSQLKAAKEFYDAEKKLLDQRNSANLISAQEYLASSMTLAIQHQTDQLAVLDKMQQEYDAASGARIEKLQSRQAAAKGKAAEALVNAIKKEQQAAEISNNAFDVKRAEIAAEAYGRVGEVLNKVQTDLGKVIETNKEFWANRALEEEAVKAATAIDDKYKDMNTSIMSMDVAMYEFEKAQHAALVQSNKQNDALRRQLVIQKDLVILMKSALEARIAAGGSTIEEVAAYKDAIWTLEDGVSKLETQLTESTAKGLEDGAKKGMDAFAKARKEQVDKLANSMSEAITDGLMSGDYKSIGKSIRNTLQKELIRKPLQAWIQAAVGSVLGGSSAQAAAGTGGFTGSGSGLDFTNFGGSVGDWLMTKSTDFGLNGFQSLSDITFSLGDTLKGVEAWLQDIPGLEGGFGSVLGYGKAIYDLTEGNYGSATGAAVGTYILPGIGTMIGSTLGGLVDDMFGSNPKEHSGGVYTSSGTRDEGLRSLGLGKHAKGDFTSRRNESIDKALDTTMTALLDTYDQLAKSAKGTVRQLDIIAAFAINPVTTSEDAYGYLQIFDKDTRELLYKNTQRDGGGLGNDPDKAFSLFTGQVISVMVKELKSADLPAWMSSVFSKLDENVTLEGFQEALTVINNVNIGFASLATTMEMFVGVSDDMKSYLLGGFGNMESLLEATQAYYDNFYTEAERLTIAGRNMNQVMQSLGLDIDVMEGDLAKEAFRKSVEAAFEADNGSLAATLLGISGQFAEVADAAQAASENLGTVEDAINSYGEALANLAEKSGYLGSTNRYAAENAAATIQSLFANIGIEKDVTSLTSSILDATTADVEDFFRELWPMMQTDAARDQLIKVSDALLDIAASSKELKLNLATLQERLGDTAAIRNFNLDTVTADLVSFGKTLGQSLDFESVRAEIAGANKESVNAYFNDVFAGLDTTEAQQKFIGITNAILDVVDATEAATEDLRSKAESLWNDQVSAAKAAVEAQIALHEREAEAVRVLINNAEQEIDRLKSEGEIFKLIAGRAFGEAGVKSGTSYTTGSSSTWEEFAAKFGFLDDKNEAMLSAQEELVADLKNEEDRHNSSIKHLQGIISESQKQTSQLMSLNTAIDILQTSAEDGIADIVAALEKSAAPAVVAPPAANAPTGDPVKDSYQGVIDLLQSQRGNALAALAGDETAATNFFNAMHEAGITMFDDVANHSIETFDKEIKRLQDVVDGMRTIVPTETATTAAVTGDTPRVVYEDGWRGNHVDEFALIKMLQDAAGTSWGEAVYGDDIREYGEKFADRIAQLLPAYDPAYTQAYERITGKAVGSTGTGVPSDIEQTTTTPSGLKPMTAAEYQEELNLQLRLFELEGNMLAVRKSQLAMMHANLRGIQAEVWAREALNTVTQQFEELNPAGKLTAIKDEAKDFIEGLSTIDASTAKGKETLADAKKLAMQVEKQRLAEARKELYGSVATERWKVTEGLRDLNKDFKDLGIAMPTTVEGFRKLVNSLPTGELKDSLLELVPSFVEATKAVEALAQKNKELYKGLLSERAVTELDTSDVTAQFAELGYTLPKSAKELKSWIDKLPTGELKDSLLELVPSFADATKAVEALVQKNKELYSNLLKPDEVTALKVADLRKDFAELGYVMPTTKEAFRNLLDTLADGELKDSLLELVPAFTSIEAVAVEASAKLSAAWASIGTASGWAAEHLLDSSGLEYQLATIRSGLANTTDVQEREAAISDIISLEQAIWDVQQKRLKKGLEATQKQLDADQEKLDSANKLLDAAKSLKEYANELMTGTNSGLSKVDQLAAKQSEYESLLAKARTGDVEAIGKLQSVSGEYLTLADELSVSQTDYSFLAGKTAAELLTLSTIQEASAKSQIEVLEYGIELAQRQLKQAEAEFELSLETKKLIEQQLEDARLQFQTETANMLNVVTGLGIANGLLEALPASLAGVLGPMINSAIASSAGSSKSSSGSSTSSAIPTPADITNPMPRPVTILPDPIYEAPKTGTSTVVKDIVTSTTPTSSAKTTSSVTMSDIIAASKADAAAGTRPEGIKTTADMIAYYRPILSGSHSTGLTSVPFDGYIAELHKGERVLTAAEAKVYTPPESTSQAELVAEIRALRAQVAALEKSASKTATNTAKLPQMAEQFDDVADGGFVRTRSIS